MKKYILISLILVSLAAVAQDNKPLPKSSEISFDKATASYAIGYRVGLQIAGRADSEYSLDYEQALKGLKAAATKADPAFTKEQMTEEYGNYQKKLQLFQSEEFKKYAAENQKRSDAFLAQNRKKTGIKELSSGIQYRVIEVGSGKNASLNDTVTLHYRGSLVGTDNFDNYQEFDNTYSRGQPLDMEMSKVGLKGWQEIIPMMKVGDKWQVFLPPELGYGIKGTGPIGPNEVLVFDVHLLGIK